MINEIYNCNILTYICSTLSFRVWYM